MLSSEKIILGIINKVKDTNETQLLLSICEPMLTRLNATECIMFAGDREAEELYSLWSITKEGKRSGQKVRVKKGKGIAGRVASDYQPIMIEDTSRDRRYLEEVGETPTRTAHKKSVLAMPLMIGGTFKGVLEIIRSQQRKFLPSDIEFVQPFANIIALTAAEGISDPLTKLAEVCIRFLEERDRYTHGHSLRVTEYSMIIAEEMGLTQDQKNELRLCALLHDIGKVAFKDSLFLIDQPLSKTQLQMIRMHAQIGYNIVSRISETVAHKILFHHENYNGTGYPQRLKGEQIPLISRIIRLADTFDAMTSVRPYRPAGETDKVIKDLSDASGKQFDPKVVEAFLTAYRNGKLNLVGS